MESLRHDVFNGRVWPDFIAMSATIGPFLRLHEIEAGRPVNLPDLGLAVTPVEVNHLVPTLGFLIDDGSSSIAIASDTGPTERLWEAGRACPNLKAVFLEAAFPNAMHRPGRRVEAPHARPLRRGGPQSSAATTSRSSSSISRPASHQILRELHELHLPTWSSAGSASPTNSERDGQREPTDGSSTRTPAARPPSDLNPAVEGRIGRVSRRFWMGDMLV